MCLYCPSLRWTSPISNKSGYEPLCLSKYCIKSLRKSIVYLLIAITHIQLDTPSIDILLLMWWKLLRHYCPSENWTSSTSDKSTYDPASHNKYSINSLRKSFVCSLIAITHIDLHTSLMGHVVVVVVEEDAPLLTLCKLNKLYRQQICVWSSKSQQVPYEFFAKIIYLFTHCHYLYKIYIPL